MVQAGPVVLRAIISHPYNERVLTSLTLLLAVAALGLAAEFPVFAIICGVGSYLLHQAAVADEEAFMGVVMILAGSYAVIVTVETLYDAIVH